MTPLPAAYDEIADWYERDFLTGQRAASIRGEGLDIDAIVRDFLGPGRGMCLEIGTRAIPRQVLRRS